MHIDRYSNKYMYVGVRVRDVCMCIYVPLGRDRIGLGLVPGPVTADPTLPVT